MKRFRVDFSIRELDVPEEQAQGIRLGQDIDLVRMRDFFDRCRDAAVTLFGAVEAEHTLKAEETAKRAAQMVARQTQAAKAVSPHPALAPKDPGEIDTLIEMLKTLGINPLGR